ncbi:MAG: hypothetical protein WA820_30070, partial [Bradyrhizobium sp.]
MNDSYRLKIGTNLEVKVAKDYRPIDRVWPGHLSGHLFRRCATQLLNERRQIAVIRNDRGEPFGI